MIPLSVHKVKTPDFSETLVLIYQTSPRNDSRCSNRFGNKICRHSVWKRRRSPCSCSVHLSDLTSPALMAMFVVLCVRADDNSYGGCSLQHPISLPSPCSWLLTWRESDGARSHSAMKDEWRCKQNARQLSSLPWQVWIKNGKRVKCEANFCWWLCHCITYSDLDKELLGIMGVEERINCF